MGLTSVELCAGGGGQALGLEMAGYDHLALVDNDKPACNTLRLNRPKWSVFEQDLEEFKGKPYKGADLVAGGLPCPPFSVAGKQLGPKDDRNMFPAGLRVVDEVRPKAVMFENVRGMLDPSFQGYREWIESYLKELGYKAQWRLLNASDFGVPQLRPRVLLVAMKNQYASKFSWPEKIVEPKTVGETLYDLMAANGWRGANQWKKQANKIAPTIVGGSKKHGGPDLGPTRARAAWAELGVEGKSIAYDAPERDFVGMPRLTTRMVARIQGFPDEWDFWGAKTPAYRQVGNAFPPPVAEAVAKNIRLAIVSSSRPAAKSEVKWQSAVA